MYLDGGLDELTDELSSGKMLYAGLKVIDPNTSLPKFVLINWVCILFHLVILPKNNHAKLSSLILPPLLSLFMTIISISTA